MRAWRILWGHLWLALGMGILLTTGLVTYQVFLGQEESIASVQLTHRTIATVQELRLALQNVETAERGYLLTADGEFLDAFEEGRTAVDDGLRRLKAFTRDLSVQQERMDQLEQLIATELAQIGAILELRRTGRTEDAVRQIDEPAVRRVEREIDGLTGALAAEAYRMLERRTLLEARQSDRLFLALLTASLIAVVLIAIAVLAMHREQAARATAEAQTRSVQMQTAHQLELQATRFRRLADACVQLNQMLSLAQPIDVTLQRIADLARDVIGAHYAAIGMMVDGGWSRAVKAVSASGQYAGRVGDPVDDTHRFAIVSDGARPVRLSRVQVQAHPLWQSEERMHAHPARGWLAVPITASDGASLGLLQLSDKYDGDFTAEDESLATQFAFMAAVAMSNVKLYRAVQSELADRRRAEEALGENLHRLDLAQQAGGIGIFDWAIGPGRIVWTRELERLYGLEQGAFDGTFDGWSRRVVPEDFVRLSELLQTATAQARAELDYEFRIMLPDGTRRWLSCRGRLFYDADGRLTRMLGTNVDITHRKTAIEEIRRLLNEAEERELELRSKQQMLVQSAKLASIGELAAGIAHEVNNPLNNIALFIGNSLDRMQREGPEDPALLSDLTRALGQVQRAAEIIMQVRTFARAAPSGRAVCSVNGVILTALALIQEPLRLLNVRVSTELCAVEPRVWGNRVQLEQVLVNLFTNARDAMVTTAERRLYVATSVSGDRVEITIQDTGCGMPPELQARIFDPFFTTKPVGQGTGLGLSISYGIVKEHHGAITAESQAGRGTTFRIQLPIQNEPLSDDAIPGVAMTSDLEMAG